MLRSAFFAVVAAGLMIGQAAPASANAALSGATKAPKAVSVVVDVRRGGRGFGGRHFRGGRHFGGVRHFRGGRHFGGHRHVHRRWRHRRGIYVGVPYVYGSYYYGSCNWLRRKAIRTGSRYWWRRYYRCRNY